MKKILLGTTAIAAAALYAQSAQAQLTVSLGGYTEFFGAYYDDDVPGRTSREFQLETEIVVRADGKADNGLLYGGKVELQNSTTASSVGTDEASVYLSGTWGRIELGDFDGAADTLAIYAPLVGIGRGSARTAWGDFAPTLPVRTAAVRLIGVASSCEHRDVRVSASSTNPQQRSLSKAIQPRASCISRKAPSGCRSCRTPERRLSLPFSRSAISSARVALRASLSGSRLRRRWRRARRRARRSSRGRAR